MILKTISEKLQNSIAENKSGFALLLWGDEYIDCLKSLQGYEDLDDWFKTICLDYPEILYPHIIVQWGGSQVELNFEWEYQ